MQGWLASVRDASQVSATELGRDNTPCVMLLNAYSTASNTTHTDVRDTATRQPEKRRNLEHFGQEVCSSPHQHDRQDRYLQTTCGTWKRICDGWLTIGDQVCRVKCLRSMWPMILRSCDTAYGVNKEHVGKWKYAKYFSHFLPNISILFFLRTQYNHHNWPMRMR